MADFLLQLCDFFDALSLQLFVVGSASLVYEYRIPAAREVDRGLAGDHFLGQFSTSLLLRNASLRASRGIAITFFQAGISSSRLLSLSAQRRRASRVVVIAKLAAPRRARSSTLSNCLRQRSGSLQRWRMLSPINGRRVSLKMVSYHWLIREHVRVWQKRRG